jgi:hypothetical protein
MGDKPKPKPKPKTPNILSSTSDGNTGQRTSIVHGKPRKSKGSK